MKTKVLKLKKFKIAKLNTTIHIQGGGQTNDGPECNLKSWRIICPDSRTEISNDHCTDTGKVTQTNAANGCIGGSQ